MRELPLLACDSVALNLREGRQTHHRAPMRPQPLVDERGFWYPRPPKDAFDPASAPQRAKHYSSLKHWLKGAALDHAPWQPGDTLYVRECHQRAHCLQHDETLPTLPCRCHETLYRADPSWSPAYGGWERVKPGCDGRTLERIERWRPSIHMPKGRARTWLKVTRSWAEEASDWTEEVARAEGFESLAAFEDFMRSTYGAQSPRWWWACALELDRQRSGVGP